MEAERDELERGSGPVREEASSEEQEEGTEDQGFSFLNLAKALEGEQSQKPPDQPAEGKVFRNSSTESESYWFSSILESPIQSQTSSGQEEESAPPGKGQPDFPFTQGPPYGEEFSSTTVRASSIYEQTRQTLDRAFSALRSNELIDASSLEAVAGQIVANIIAFSPERYDIRSPLFEESLYSCIVESFGKPFDLVEHSINVAILSVTFARERGISQAELERLCLAALLHDVGMLMLSTEVWNHPRSLSGEEWAAVRCHADQGRELLFELGEPLSDVAPIVGQEHERADGSGYPLGLKSQEIDEYAKIIGMVDVLEALTHGRPHRHPHTPHQAVRTILSDMRESFDRGLVKALLSLVTVFPLGSWVELSTGEVGRVVQINSSNPLRPVVEVLRGADGLTVPTPLVRELWGNPIISISRCLDGPP